MPANVLVGHVKHGGAILLDLIVAFTSLLLPIFKSNCILVLLSFSLLNVNGTLVRASLGPLLSGVMDNRQLTDSLAFKRFMGTVTSFLTPCVTV